MKGTEGKWEKVSLGSSIEFYSFAIGNLTDKPLKSRGWFKLQLQTLTDHV